MKDGRPSRINDIRIFWGGETSRASGYLKGCEDAVAFGRRIALYLNGERYSLGAHSALYLFLTTALEPKTVKVTDEGAEWWHRYTHVGVPNGFPDFANASEIVVQATIDALKANRPDLTDMVESAARVTRREAENLRLLIKTRRTKKLIIDTSLAIDVWPRPSHLFLSLTELASGAYLEAPPIALTFYNEAFNLAGQIGINTTAVRVSANKGLGAQLAAQRHGGTLIRTLDDFIPTARPAFSKLVNMRG